MSNLQVTFEAVRDGAAITIRLAPRAPGFGGIFMWIGDGDSIEFDADAAGELAGAIDLLAGGAPEPAE